MYHPSHEQRDFVYDPERPGHLHQLPAEYNYPEERAPSPREERPPTPPTTLERYDPEEELASFLYIMVQGQIEYAEVTRSDLLRLSYRVIHGSEWEIIEGDAELCSQIAKRGDRGIVTWNLEFNVGFRSLSLSGWPQLVLELRGPNRAGEEVLKGYGCVHIPTCPGQHSKVVRLFCPVKDTWWDRVKNWVWGPECQVIDDLEQIASGEGREVTTVEYIGRVKVAFQMMQRNFDRFGYKSF